MCVNNRGIVYNSSSSINANTSTSNDHLAEKSRSNYTSKDDDGEEGGITNVFRLCFNNGNSDAINSDVKMYISSLHNALGENSCAFTKHSIDVGRDELESVCPFDPVSPSWQKYQMCCIAQHKL
uniref:Telomere length regulation protein clk-2 n=1 Tax=Lygus hesperus TaxID=30085 RepID=A0A0A9Z4T4_LYGHE